MKKVMRNIGIFMSSVALGAVIIVACNQTKIADAQDNSKVTAQSPDAMAFIADWPEKPKQVAQKMVSMYGQPDEMTKSMLVWNNNGPWKRTILHRQEVKHNFPVEHTDLLEQFIDYEIPEDKVDELAHFDGSVMTRRTDGEIAAKCDKEGANFLALNLADEVATGKRTVEDARNFYAKTIKEFVLENKPSPYLQGLQFTVKKGGTNDPDMIIVDKETHMKIQEKMKQMK